MNIEHIKEHLEDQLAMLKSSKDFMDFTLQTERIRTLKASIEGSTRYLKWISEVDDSALSIVFNGQNIATCATLGGHIETLNWIINYNKNFLQHSDKDGKNCAIHAAASGNTEILELIVNADPELLQHTDNSGKNVVIHAAAGGHCETLEFIAKQDKILFTHSDKNGNTFAKYIQANCNEEINYLKTGVERSPAMMKFILTFFPKNIFSTTKDILFTAKDILVKTAPIAASLAVSLFSGYKYAKSNNTPEYLLKRAEIGKINLLIKLTKATDVIIKEIIDYSEEIPPMSPTFAKDMIYGSGITSLISAPIASMSYYWNSEDINTVEENCLLGDSDTICKDN